MKTMFKNIIAELKFWEDCKKYGIGLWQCPRFLFVVMGLLTITSTVGTHLVAVRYAEPEIVVIIVVGVTLLIFTVGHIVVGSFEKMAAANRMKTEFVSIVSHQLRSPLSSLKWSLGLIISGRIGTMQDKQLEQLGLLKKSTDRMIDLVNDLLNVTRIEQGRIVLRREKIKLDELVKEVIEHSLNLAQANNVRLVMENKLDSALVEIDRQYIFIVLDNFISNAIRYINNKENGGRGEVQVFLQKRGNVARLEVKDSGVGIPRDEQRNIFKKFFRAQNAMRHRTEGSGLGLYISKAFVELHGGKIGFSSEVGRGSTFWFELPIKT